MFKKIFVTALACIALIYGCKKESTDLAPKPASVSLNQTSSYAGYALKGTDDDYSRSIPVDSANRMISSYLTSIDYPSNETSLRSLAFSADSLRDYLNDSNIKTIRFMFAHQPAYINAGHFGEPSGMNPDALTLVIVGMSNTGAYILNKNDEVFEHCKPCPKFCASSADFIY